MLSIKFLLKDLYVEALYTIVHKLGCSASHKKLINYVRQAFDMDEAHHKRLMFRATEEKVLNYKTDSTLIPFQRSLKKHWAQLITKKSWQYCTFFGIAETIKQIR